MVCFKSQKYFKDACTWFFKSNAVGNPWTLKFSCHWIFIFSFSKDFSAKYLKSAELRKCVNLYSLFDVFSHSIDVLGIADPWIAKDYSQKWWEEWK